MEEALKQRDEEWRVDKGKRQCLKGMPGIKGQELVE